MPGWAKALIMTLVIAAGTGLLWWRMSIGPTELQLDGHNYEISVMRSEAELEHGLSGTNSLPADHAMLFVFPYATKWAMWMKDMKYPIDMVWLSSDKKVVYLVKNATPASYPGTQFRPDTDTSYVIELPSGTIERTGIKQGDPAGLPSGV